MQSELIEAFCTRVVQSKPIDGETGEQLACYVRLRAGRTARGRSTIGRIELSDDPSKLADELEERIRAGVAPGQQVWIEALVRRESTAWDSLRLQVEHEDEDGLDIDPSGKGQDFAIKALTWAIVQQSQSADDRATRAEARAERLTERVLQHVETIGEQRTDLVIAQLDAGADNGMGEALAGLLPIAAVVGAKLLGVGGQGEQETEAPAAQPEEAAPEPQGEPSQDELAGEIVDLLKSNPEALKLVREQLAQAGAA